MKKGKVYLVGAGPGHPELLTVKAYKLIGQADVIVYDRLVQKDCMAHARADAELIYVGKLPGRHEARQREINDILARKALQGYMVVRLKGGDPLLFSRGGEEAAYLAELGIPFEFVPGVTSALAAAAAAGIAVTHRDFSDTFCVVTGHHRRDEDHSVDFEALAKMGTVSVLMGVRNMEHFVRRLLAAGKSGSTPVAVVQRAYWPGEKVLFSRLDKVTEEAKRQGIEPPAVLIVGEVAKRESQLRQGERELHRAASPTHGHERRAALRPFGARCFGQAVLYPINVMLEGARVLVVGGGRVAERRVERLLMAAARIRLVAPRLTGRLARLVRQDRVEHLRRRFRPEDLDGVVLAFAATSSAEVNRLVAFHARKQGVLVNVADDPVYCDFTVPACVVRGALVIAVQSSARAPGLSAALRRRLEVQFGDEWGKLCDLIADERPALLKLGLPPREITERIDNLLDSDVLSMLERGRDDEARALVRTYLGTNQTRASSDG